MFLTGSIKVFVSIGQIDVLKHWRLRIYKYILLEYIIAIFGLTQRATSISPHLFQDGLNGLAPQNPLTRRCLPLFNNMV